MSNVIMIINYISTNLYDLYVIFLNIYKFTIHHSKYTFSFR